MVRAFATEVARPFVKGLSWVQGWRRRIQYSYAPSDIPRDDELMICKSL